MPFITFIIYQDCDLLLQISTLRLNWYGLNYSTVDRRDFYLFSNLSEILIEPSNTTGFSTRTISEEEYENPKLWTTYEAVGVFGRVLNVRLFSSFVKESCCSKWLSRIVLAHLLSSEATASWFKHCFRGFNLFCQENRNKPPKWMIMAWIQSLDEFKDLMANYCLFKRRKTARFKRNIIKAFWNQDVTENNTKSFEDAESVKTIYKYENQGSNEALHRVVKDQVTPKQDTDALIQNESKKTDFYKKLTAFLVAMNCLTLIMLSGTCCLYCKAKGALELAGKYGSTLTQYRGSTLKNASLNRRESVQSLDESDREKRFVSSNLNPNQTIVSNNNNYLSNKAAPNEASSTKDKADGGKKFVKRLRTILGLRPSNSLDSNTDERERLVPRASDNGDQNNNNTTNLNTSNSTADDLANVGNAGHPTLESDGNESLDLSDEEELEQIFLDHLYNRMRAQSRYDYLTQFDKYGYCDHRGESFK